jgi:hypothetical protein
MTCSYYCYFYSYAKSAGSISARVIGGFSAAWIFLRKGDFSTPVVRSCDDFCYRVLYYFSVAYLEYGETYLFFAVIA